jgi:hypothetical protein
MISQNINQTFLDWTKAKVRSLKGGAFFGFTALSAAFNFFVALDIGSLPRYLHMPILYGSQAAVILIISATIAFGRKPLLFSKYKRGSQVVQQFWNWWPRLWFGWFLLYVGLTVWEIYSASGAALSGTSKHLIILGLHQLNNMTTLVLLMLFHILAEPSVPDKEYPPEGDIFAYEHKSHGPGDSSTESIRTDGAKFMFWVALFIAAGIAEAGLVLIGKNVDSLLLIFGIGYGVLAATAIALVVGQLDNHLLGINTVTIVFLFLYSGIQPSFDFVLEARSDILILAAREVIVVIALVSKVILFTSIQWLSMTDRLLYYMVQNYSLYKGVDAHRQKFLEGLDEAFYRASA